MANIGGRGFGDVVLDQQVLDALIHSPAGPVARLLVKVGEQTTQEAKRRAPVGDRSSKTPGGHPSGWLRSNIGWAVGRDGGDLVVDIVSDAITSQANPFPGEPYSVFVEEPSLRPRGLPEKFRKGEGPYLRPAFLDVIKRVIG
ncbi:MAG TPA: HK97 gp10 family phage protein [Thermoanaerobaculaceae bacterium]|nr:HK97 gp10 family phage protein [Thermoanaerobaculaceae bacterium]